MFVFNTKKELQKHLNSINNKTVGYVPTMGALHIGHLSLIEKSFKECDVTVVSIFVNPTQFNNQEDLEKYPRTVEKDVELIKTVSDKIIVFNPTAQEIYNDKIQSKEFSFDGIENQMEGKFRPGHFDGVGTILELLFDAVKPDIAFFGEKDFQQLQIIKKLIPQIENQVKIIGCPIYREENGLAFSSRNERLPKITREKAQIIYESLNEVKSLFGTKSVNYINEYVVNKFKNNDLFELEYFEIADVEKLETAIKINNNTKYRAFIAVYANDIRLIDNIALN